ncbi:hypothetical protein ABZ370_35205 [Streptomyces sp. NPDC005962]|uniref:hypothetical protein n=1 Tax=Streptomyces sp. NPDC005962 TaxID=3154466 RepID=UPI0033F6CF35
MAFIDIDSTHNRVFGPAKQGAQVSRFKGIRTLHPLLATICTPTARPVIAAVRLRQGKSADSRGAGRFVTEALATAGEAGSEPTQAQSPRGFPEMPPHFLLARCLAGRTGCGGIRSSDVAEETSERCDLPRWARGAR